MIECFSRDCESVLGIEKACSCDKIAFVTNMTERMQLASCDFAFPQPVHGPPQHMWSATPIRVPARMFSHSVSLLRGSTHDLTTICGHPPPAACARHLAITSACHPTSIRARYLAFIRFRQGNAVRIQPQHKRGLKRYDRPLALLQYSPRDIAFRTVHPSVPHRNLAPRADLPPPGRELPPPGALAFVVCGTAEPADEEREPVEEDPQPRVDAEQGAHAQQQRQLRLQRGRVASHELRERAGDMSDGVPVSVCLAPERPVVLLRVEVEDMDEESVHEAVEVARRGLARRLLEFTAPVLKVFCCFS